MAEDINTSFFAYGSPMSLPDSIKIWVTSVYPSCPNFASKWLTPVDLSIGEWKASRKPPSLTPYNLLSPKMDVSNVPLWPTSRCVLPPGEYDRRYIQGSCMLCRMSLWAERCCLLPNYFGPCLLHFWMNASNASDMAIPCVSYVPSVCLSE